MTELPALVTLLKVWREGLLVVLKHIPETGAFIIEVVFHDLGILHGILSRNVFLTNRNSVFLFLNDNDLL